MSTSQQRNHTPGVMKFTNFGKPFLGHHYHTNNLSEPYPEERRRFLKKYVNFTLFTTTLRALGMGVHLGRGVMKFIISCLLTLQILHAKFV